MDWLGALLEDGKTLGVRSFYRMDFDLDGGLIYEIRLNLREKTEIENRSTLFEKRKNLLYLRESATRFSTFVFFHESVSPRPPSIPLGPF